MTGCFTDGKPYKCAVQPIPIGTTDNAAVSSLIDANAFCSMCVETYQMHFLLLLLLFCFVFSLPVVSGKNGSISSIVFIIHYEKCQSYYVLIMHSGNTK